MLTTVEDRVMAPTDGSLNKVLTIFQRMSQFDVKMQLSTAMALLYVAKYQDRDGGVTTADLSKWLGVTAAAASRNSYYWADGTHDMPGGGFGLISISIDQEDRRRRCLRLTPRGEAFIDQLREVANG